MICRYCGNNIEDNASFCPNCGANLAAERQLYGEQQPAGSGDPFGNAQNTGNENYPSFPQANTGLPQVDPNFKPPKTSKKVKVLAFLIMALFFAVVFSVIKHLNSDVYGVKNGHPNLYPDKSWGEALDDVCSNSKWKAYKEDGQRYVKYTGKVKSDGDKLVIIFKVASDRKTFEVDDIQKGGETQTKLIIAEIFKGEL